MTQLLTLILTWYRPNYTSLTAPPPSIVTLPAYRNVYVYCPMKLWAAYGAAVFLTLIAVLSGAVAMYMNGACYSENFSTVFGAVSGAEMDGEIKEEDAGGEDPLPAYLAETRVRFRREGRSEGEVVRPKYDRK